MIYLDNAATTYPKPLAVRQAVAEALQCYGANPGRGGHRLSMVTAAQIYACREALSDFFHVGDSSRVIFTMNCTGALNTLLKGLLKPGDHVIVSGMEHNSVMRPLYALASKGITYTEAVHAPQEIPYITERIRHAIQPNTRLILCMHASNVFGYRFPIREIGKLAKTYGVFFAVDAAQSAGILPIDMAADAIDFLCVPAHKGLYGPMGCGALLCRSEEWLVPLVEGGTGSQSLLQTQPEDLPDRLESGTVNVPGICGLHAGVQWVNRQGVQELAEREMAGIQWLYHRLANTDGVRLYTPYPRLETAVPVLSLNVRDVPAEEVAAQLNRSGIAVRAGLHCAPAAHRCMGTLDTGTVRICPSAFTTPAELEKTFRNLNQIARKPCNKF